jgi:hypothetical protein
MQEFRFFQANAQYLLSWTKPPGLRIMLIAKVYLRELAFISREMLDNVDYFYDGFMTTIFDRKMVTILWKLFSLLH